MIYHLNDKKVVRRFGSHPERGIPLKGISKRVTVGVRWSLPRRKYEPDTDVLVNPIIALHSAGKGKWKLICEPAYHRQAEQFLLENLI